MRTEFKMKRMLTHNTLRCHILLLALLATLTCAADDKFVKKIEVDGLTYELYKDKEYNELTAYLRRATEQGYSGEVYVPEYITYKNKSYKVKIENYDVFSWSEGLRKVKIDATWKYSIPLMFRVCPYLESVVVNDKSPVNFLDFYHCKSLKYFCANGERNGNSKVCEERVYWRTGKREKYWSGFNVYGCSSLSSIHVVNLEQCLKDFRDEKKYGCKDAFAVQADTVFIDDNIDAERDRANIIGKHLVVADHVTSIKGNIWYNGFETAYIPPAVKVSTQAFLNSPNLKTVNPDNESALAAQNYSKAVDLEKQGKTAEALPFWKEASNHGFVYASYTLAEKYLKGDERNKMMRKIAEQTGDDSYGARSYVSLLDLYESIMTRAKANKVDTTGLAMEREIFARKKLPKMFNESPMTETKKEIDEYMSICEALQLDRSYQHVVKDWGDGKGIGYGILYENEDLKMLDDAKKLCDISSPSPFAEFKKYAKGKFDLKKSQISKKIADAKKVMHAAIEEERERNRRSANAEMRNYEARTKSENGGLTAQDFFTLTTKKTVAEVRSFLESKQFVFGNSKKSEWYRGIGDITDWYFGYKLYWNPSNGKWRRDNTSDFILVVVSYDDKAKRVHGVHCNFPYRGLRDAIEELTKKKQYTLDKSLTSEKRTMYINKSKDEIIFETNNNGIYDVVYSKHVELYKL